MDIAVSHKNVQLDDGYGADTQLLKRAHDCLRIANDDDLNFVRMYMRADRGRNLVRRNASDVVAIVVVVIVIDVPLLLSFGSLLLLLLFPAGLLEVGLGLV